jgi:hypothetical protein
MTRRRILRGPFGFTPSLSGYVQCGLGEVTSARADRRPETLDFAIGNPVIGSGDDSLYGSSCVLNFWSLSYP